METRERVERFFVDTGAKKSQFCKRIGMSTCYLYRYLKEGYNISDELTNRINAYLDEVYTK